MSRGADMLALRDVYIPAGRLIRAAQAVSPKRIPILWAAAGPPAHVTRDAYERIAGDIVDAVYHHDVDAVYCDLMAPSAPGTLTTARRHYSNGCAASQATIYGSSRRLTCTRMSRIACWTPPIALLALGTYRHVDTAETGGQVAAMRERRHDGAAPIPRSPAAAHDRASISAAATAPSSARAGR
ncbi:hypothetical protein MB84_28635 (plasmid) [Pandoraea oxalativorans]|uniref:Microcystin LR degradation protein MlrC N-terminal domain-containing protein n=1 Tax=Pandoraea oxalativorans TaxID=573737 RepID=A0A192B141_9BURK|nr:hypothetical protein MB84_28635 [Pandoraea oxalativorans]